MTPSKPMFGVFWVCAAALTAVLAWITAYTLRLEQRAAYAQAVAGRQEATRLALWRMDSAMTPVIAREAARPYFHYQSFYPTDRAFTNMLKEVKPGDVLVPSPLLDAPVGVIRLYFEIGGDGGVHSPQVPRGDQQRLTRPGTYTTTNLVAAQDQLEQFTAMLERPASTSAFRLRSSPQQHGPEKSVPPGAAVVYSDGGGDITNEFGRRQERLALASTPEVAPENAVAYRALKDKKAREHDHPGTTVGTELAVVASGRDPVAAEAKVESDRNAQGVAPPPGRSAPLQPPGEPPEAARTKQAKSDDPGQTAEDDERSGLSMTDLVPSWIGPEENPQLVFSRRVLVNGQESVQGFWLDWQLTRSWLLSGIGDLLPWADLQPVRDDVRDRPPEALGRTLASIPAELVVRETLAAAPIGWSPLRFGLLISWAAVLVALALTWRVLRALHELAERRGRFAAAVTHELRTPITTFRMYSQMLAEDMVPAERRHEYLTTMNTESQRLAGIVESVLEYARLGRRDPGRAVQTIDLHALLEPLAAKLAEHAAGRGFELRSGISAAAGVMVKADPTGVERVLLNLVDNACKYALGHDPRTVTLNVRLARRHAVISIADNGPGLTAEESRRVFEPYFRGPRTTELGVPGIGLGLALAKGAARSMGGDLRLVQAADGKGATFALMLELAD